MAGADPPLRWQRRKDTGQPLSVFDTVTRRNSIRGILLFIVLVAFVPTLGLFAWQGIERLTRDRTAEQHQLFVAATMISRSEANIISDSQRILSVLAVVPAVRSRDQARCGPILAETVKRFPGYARITVSDPEGRVACASDPRTVGTAPDTTRLWTQFRASHFVVTAPGWDEATQRPMLRAMMPLQSETGDFAGVIAASIDLVWLREALTRHQDRDKTAIMLVDGRGRSIVQTRSLPWDRLVMPKTGTSGTPAPIVTLPDGNGARWSYAVAPLNVASDGGEAYSIVYAAILPGRFDTEWWLAIAFFLLPLLALALAAAAVWFGANRAILRWVSHLGELARQIGTGEGAHPRFRLSFADAPSEIRYLAAELLRVGNAITDREQRLHRSAAAQAAVAMELHHRVRNNLQIMASFVSLQAESVPPGPARQALEAAQLRVATMAVVNGLLYADAEVTTVSLAALLDTIGDLLARHSGIAAQISVDPLLEHLPVDIDRAMPLSLWIVEAAVCLFEVIDADRKPNCFSLSVSNDDDVVCVAVRMRGTRPAPFCHSLHRRLVTAIAHQLGGRSQIDAVGTSGTRVVLHLPHGKLAAGPGLGSAGMTTEMAA